MSWGLVCDSLVDYITISHQDEAIEKGKSLTAWLVDSTYYGLSLIVSKILQQFANVFSHKRI